MQRTIVIAAAAGGVLIGAALSGFLLSGGGGDANGGSERPRGGPRGGYAPVVSMAVAEEAAVARKVEVIGRARAQRSVAIVAEATGLVEAVNIAPGQRVEKGDVLLQIDDDEQQVALARARAEYPIALSNADRYRDLESDEAASALEAEQAQTNYVSVQAELRAAEVAVAQRKIVAPFDGIVGLTDIEAGDYLRAGDTVTTLDDTSSIIVEFAVPQESAAFVNMGQEVSAALTSNAALLHKGEVTAIDSRVDPDSRTLRVEARVDNQDGRLLPGAVLTVTTVAEGEPAVAAPGLAVQWDRNGAYVWRRNADGVAERAGVVILQRTNDRVLVEGALEPGDVIASEGADRVRAGVPLPPVETGSSGRAVGSAAGGRE